MIFKRATLIAALAFGACVQVLSPAPAAAMINQGVGACEPVSGFSGGMGWNFTTGQSCFLSKEVGGSGDEELVEIEGDAPLTDCALEDELEECMPTDPFEDDPLPGESTPPPQPGLGFFPGKWQSEETRELARQKRVKECVELNNAGRSPEWLDMARERLEDLAKRDGAIHEKWQNEGLEDWEWSEMRRIGREISKLRRARERVDKARREFDKKKCAGVLEENLDRAS